MVYILLHYINNYTVITSGFSAVMSSGSPAVMFSGSPAVMSSGFSRCHVERFFPLSCRA